MTTPTSTPAQLRLTKGLARLKELQAAGVRAFKADEFTRQEITALLSAGFLQRVIKGWYIAARPGEAVGDTTAWNASMRDFIGRYCDERFGQRWHLSSELSVLVHAGAPTLPKQIYVVATGAQRNCLDLPNGNSIFDSTPREPIDDQHIVRIGPVRVLALPMALVGVSETFFRTYPTDAQVALGQLSGAADTLRILLQGGHSFIAGRLAGALRAAHQPRVAQQIVDAMRSAGYAVTEANPFTIAPPNLGGQRVRSPYVDRLRIMWRTMRDAVKGCFPSEPGRPVDVRAYLAAVADAYQSDAYHSLSIEGYHVTDDLIARVARGDWNPDADSHDAETKNAMAAHGYYLAHNALQQSLTEILKGANPGEIADRDHSEWYLQLFTPSVTAGILTKVDLAGYRSGPVFIRGALHVPPDASAVRDMMPTLFELLSDEESTAVRATLGHFAFVFIHPYIDGNGRIGRLLMNAMLASGGYPWTIIPVTRRREYMDALQAASTEADIVPFATFIASCIGVAPPPAP